MSRLAEFRALEKQLVAQLAELEALKSDKGFKQEIEFEQKLRDLLGEYGYSLKNVISILDPQAAPRQIVPASDSKNSRKPRQMKIYKNPHNGEIVETKGGNHKVLKEWKAQWGADVVESWLAE